MAGDLVGSCECCGRDVEIVKHPGIGYLCAGCEPHPAEYMNGELDRCPLVKAPVEWCDTGIAAGYCLRCGMCTCSPQSETHARVEDVRCPLHGAGTDHPRVPPDESPGEPVDSPGGPITAPGPSEPGSGPPGRT